MRAAQAEITDHVATGRSQLARKSLPMTHPIRRESRDDDMVGHVAHLEAWEDDGGATGADACTRDVPSEGQSAAGARLANAPRTG